MSRPARGAWIETYVLSTCFRYYRLSRPARGAWIETQQLAGWHEPALSRPARGAWIETSQPARRGKEAGVAPRAGRVD